MIRKLIFFIIINVVIAGMEACVSLAIQSSLLNNNLLNISECEPKTIYYNFDVGETLLLTCAKVTANPYTYLTFDGNLNWNENSIKKNITFTQQKNNTIIECSLKNVHNDIWPNPKSDIGHIQVMFQLKAANITKYTSAFTLMDELITSATKSTMIPPVIKFMHNSNKSTFLTLNRLTTTAESTIRQSVNSKAPPMTTMTTSTNESNITTNETDIKSKTLTTLPSNIHITDSNFNPLLSFKENSVLTTSSIFPTTVEGLQTTPTIYLSSPRVNENSNNTTKLLHSIEHTTMAIKPSTNESVVTVDTMDTNHLTPTPIPRTFLLTKSSLNPYKDINETLTVTTSPTSPTTLGALMTTPTIPLATLPVNKNSNNATYLLHSVVPITTNVNTSTNESKITTNETDIKSKTFTTLPSIIHITDSNFNPLLSFKENSALTTSSIFPSTEEGLLTTPSTIYLSSPRVNENSNNTTNLLHSVEHTTTTITPSTNESINTVDKMHTEHLTPTPIPTTFLLTKSSLNPYKDINETLSATTSATSPTTLGPLMTTPTISLAKLPVNKNSNNATYLLHSVVPITTNVTTSTNESKITTNETDIKSKTFTTFPSIIHITDSNFNPLLSFKENSALTTSSIFPSTEEGLLTTPSTIYLSSPRVNENSNNTTNLLHSVEHTTTTIRPSTNESINTVDKMHTEHLTPTPIPTTFLLTKSSLNPYKDINETLSVTTSATSPTTLGPLMTTPTISLAKLPVNKNSNNATYLLHSVVPITTNVTTSTNESKITTNETDIKSKTLTTLPSTIHITDSNFNPLLSFKENSFLTTSSIFPTTVKGLLTTPSTIYLSSPRVNEKSNNTSKLLHSVEHTTMAIMPSTTESVITVDTMDTDHLTPTPIPTTFLLTISSLKPYKDINETLSVTTSPTSPTTLGALITTPTISLATLPVNKNSNNATYLLHSVVAITTNVTTSTNESKITTNETDIKSKTLTTLPSTIHITDSNFNPLLSFKENSALTTSSIFPSTEEGLLTTPSTIYLSSPRVNENSNNTTNLLHSVEHTTTTITPSTNESINTVDKMHTEHLTPTPIPTTFLLTKSSLNPYKDINETLSVTTSPTSPTTLGALMTTPTISLATLPVNKNSNNATYLLHSVVPITTNVTTSTNESKITTNETDIKSKTLTTLPSTIHITDSNFNPLLSFKENSALTTSSIFPSTEEGLLTTPSTIYLSSPRVNENSNNTTNLLHSVEHTTTTITPSTNESINTVDKMHTEHLTPTPIPTTFLLTKSSLNPYKDINETLSVTTSPTSPTTLGALMTTPTISLATLPVNKNSNNATYLLHSVVAITTNVTTSTNESKITTNETDIKSKSLTTLPSTIHITDSNFNPLLSFKENSALTTSSIFPSTEEGLLTTPSTIYLSSPRVNENSNNTTNLLHSVEHTTTTITPSTNESINTVDKMHTEHLTPTPIPTTFLLTKSSLNPYKDINETLSVTTSATSPTTLGPLMTTPTISLAKLPVNKNSNNATYLLHSVVPITTNVTTSTNESKITTNETDIKSKTLTTLPSTIHITDSNFNPLLSFKENSALTTSSIFPSTEEGLLTMPSTIYLSSPRVNENSNNTTNLLHSVEHTTTTITPSTNESINTVDKMHTEHLTPTPIPTTFLLTKSSLNPYKDINETLSVTTSPTSPTTLGALMTTPTISLATLPVNKNSNNATYLLHSVVPITTNVTTSTNESKITTNETDIKSKTLTTLPSTIHITDSNFNPLLSFKENSALTASSIFPSTEEGLITTPSTIYLSSPRVNENSNNTTNLLHSVEHTTTTITPSTNESINTVDKMHTEHLTPTPIPTTFLLTKSSLNPYKDINETLSVTTSPTSPTTLGALMTTTTISLATLPVNKNSNNATYLLHSVVAITTNVTTSTNESKITTNEMDIKSKTLTTLPSTIHITDSNFNPLLSFKENSALTTSSIFPSTEEGLLTMPSTVYLSSPRVNENSNNTTNLLHSVEHTTTTITPWTNESINTVDKMHTEHLTPTPIPTTFLLTKSSLNPYKDINETLSVTTSPTSPTTLGALMTTPTISLATLPVNKNSNNATYLLHSVVAITTNVTTSTNESKITTNETDIKSKTLTTLPSTIHITDSNFNPLLSFKENSALTTSSIFPSTEEGLLTTPSTIYLSSPRVNENSNNTTNLVHSVEHTTTTITPSTNESINTVDKMHTEHLTPTPIPTTFLLTKSSLNPYKDINETLSVTTSATSPTTLGPLMTTPTISLAKLPVNKNSNNATYLLHSVVAITTNVTTSTNESKITTNETDIKSKTLTTLPSTIHITDSNFNPLLSFKENSALTTSSIFPSTEEGLLTTPSTIYLSSPRVNENSNNTTNLVHSVEHTTTTITPSTNESINTVDKMHTEHLTPTPIPTTFLLTKSSLNPYKDINETLSVTTSATSPTTLGPLMTTPTISLAKLPVNKNSNNATYLLHSVVPITTNMTTSTNESKITTNETDIKSKTLTTLPSTIHITDSNFNPLLSFKENSFLTMSSIFPTTVEGLLTTPSTIYLSSPRVNEKSNNTSKLLHSVEHTTMAIMPSTTESVITVDTMDTDHLTPTPIPTTFLLTISSLKPYKDINETLSVTTSPTSPTTLGALMTTPTISLATLPVNKNSNNATYLLHSVVAITTNVTTSTNESKIITNETDIKSKTLTTLPSTIHITDSNFNPLLSFKENSALTTSSIFPLTEEGLLTMPSTIYLSSPRVNENSNNTTNLLHSVEHTTTTITPSTNESINTVDKMHTEHLTPTPIPTTFLLTKSSLNPYKDINETLSVTTSTSPTTLGALMTTPTISLATLPVNKNSNNATYLLHSVVAITTNVTTSTNESKITTNETDIKSKTLTTLPSTIHITDSNFNPLLSFKENSALTSSSIFPSTEEGLLTTPSTIYLSSPRVNENSNNTTNSLHSVEHTTTTITPSTNESINTVNKMHTEHLTPTPIPTTFLLTKSSLNPYKDINETLSVTTSPTSPTTLGALVTTPSTISLDTPLVNKNSNNATNFLHLIEPAVTIVTTSAKNYKITTNEADTKTKTLTTLPSTIHITNSNFNPLSTFKNTSSIINSSTFPTTIENLITTPSTISLSIPPVNKYLNGNATLFPSILATITTIPPFLTSITPSPLSTPTMTKQKSATRTLDKAIMISTLTSTNQLSTRSVLDHINISDITTTEMTTKLITLMNHPTATLIRNSSITTSKVTSAMTMSTSPDTTLNEHITVPTTITVSELFMINLTSSMTPTSTSEALPTFKAASSTISTSVPKKSVRFNKSLEPSEGLSSTIQSKINSITPSSNTKVEKLSSIATWFWNSTTSSISSTSSSTIPAMTTNIPVTTKSTVISSTPTTLSSLDLPTASLASEAKSINNYIEKKNLPDMMAFIVFGVLLISVLIGSFIGIYKFVKRDTGKKKRQRVPRKHINIVDPEIPAYPPQWNSNIYKTLENESNSSSIVAKHEDLYTKPVPKSARHKIEDEVTYANEAISKEAQRTNRVEIPMDVIYNNTLPRNQKEYKPEWIYANEETSSSEPPKAVYAQIKPKGKRKQATYVNTPKKFDVVTSDNTQPTYSDPHNIYDKLL